MLYIEPDLLHNIFEIPSVGKSVAAFFSTPIINDSRLFSDLRSWCLLLDKIENDLEIESRFYEIMAALLQRHSMTRIQTEPIPDYRKKVEAGHMYLMDNLTQNIGLSDLACQSGLSPYHFLREFRRSYGLPPHSYQLQQRIHAAKRLLIKGQPIAQVASDLGFADQSHFTCKFKTLVGATPGQYQQAGHL